MTASSAGAGGEPAAHPHPGPRPLGTSSIGSFLDGSGQAVILLGGVIDTKAVERLGARIEDILAASIRFLIITAAAVSRYVPELLDLLEHTQHRLGHQRGLLRVTGLHPSLLHTAAAPTPIPSREPDDPYGRPPADSAAELRACPPAGTSP